MVSKLTRTPTKESNEDHKTSDNEETPAEVTIIEPNMNTGPGCAILNTNLLPKP